MKVTITEIDGVADGIRALGLAAWGQMDGVSVAVLGGGVVKPEPMATSAALAPSATWRLLAAKKKAAKPKAPKSVKTAGPVKTAKAKRLPKAAHAPDDPANPEKLTIRSRVIEVLRSGPKTSSEVAAALRAQGVAINQTNAGQHLYFLVQDDIAVRDKDAGTWSLAA